MIRRISSPLALTGALLLAACDGGTGPEARPGFVTAQPAQAVGLNGATVKAILSVGDTIPGTNLAWAPKPDGLGAYREGTGLVVLANHELGLEGLRTTEGQMAFGGARVSRLVLDPRTISVRGGGYLLNGSEGYQRLCSATFATAAEGFPGGWFLTGEEATGSGKDGMQLAVSRTGQIVEMPWMGRFRHENAVPVPGFANRVMVMGLDDTPAASELYLYAAANEADVLAGRGALYVFVANSTPNPGAIAAGQTITGRFVEIPGAAQMSSSALQAAVDALGAFPFVRLEDGDYDRRPGLARPAFYFVDSGGAGIPAGGAPWDPFGSIYRIDFDPQNPLANVRLTLLARSAGPGGWASPDNVGTSRRSLMVQEDPAHPQFTRAPRIWRFPLAGEGSLGAPTAVAELTNPECRLGLGSCWESSGIIDASAWLGEGAWLFDVQAHTLPVPSLKLPNEGGQLLYLRVEGS